MKQSMIDNRRKDGEAARIDERSPVDPSMLARHRRLGGVGLARLLIDIFLTTAPRHVETMRSAAGDQDLGAIRLSAHSLKSTAGNLGAVELYQLADRIEQEAMAGHAALITERIDVLNVALGQAVRIIEAEREKDQG